jgi:hypothetical protein
MINSLIVYNIAELEKKQIQAEAHTLLKSKVINQEQWQNIKSAYQSDLYTPSFFIRILFFIFSLIGMSTLIGPLFLLFGDIGEHGYRVLSFLLGIGLIVFTEKIFIKDRKHYLSGITEAGIYSGLSFVAFAIISFRLKNTYLPAFIGLLLSAFAAIRYLNKIALVATIGFMCWTLFLVLSNLGNIGMSLMPFIYMMFAGALFWSCQKLQTKLTSIIFADSFLIVKILSLMLFYLSGNYFVVRQLSENLMNVSIAEGGDIPFAFLFYTTTALVPIGYLYWGIKTKSILFIRVSLLVITLSVITLKYYFSLGHPEVTITLAGALLIIISISLLYYLKIIRNGFTRDLLLCDKWHSQDLTAFIASQTLGGNKIEAPANDAAQFKDGQFGGGGAGQSW